MNLPYFDEATLTERIDLATAVQILADALAAGLDPELDSRACSHQPSAASS